MPNSLKIDIDGTLNKNEWFNTLKSVLRLVKPTGAFISIHKTRRGFHIYLDLINPKKALSNKDLLIIQLLLGSDPAREMFNYERVVYGQEDWNVLFKKKWQNKKLLSQETHLETLFYYDPEQKAKEINFKTIEKRNKNKNIK